MARRRSSSHPIGNSESPDLDLQDLARVELERLDAGFELEDARVSAVSLAEVNAGSGRVRRVYLEDVELVGSKLRAVGLVDVAAERIDSSNGDWGGAELRRVRFNDARLTGLNLGEARIEEVSFTACKLDYANFRHSKITHVSFEDCVLTGADFQGASIEATLFSGCQLVEADFSRAEMDRVDLRGSQLAPAGSLLGLRGAIIDSSQLFELTQTLAAELGIIVDDG
jgi:uncharacterized protein YjbI with pentapeptide repeats